jgi:hypothetical protein
LRLAVDALHADQERADPIHEIHRKLISTSVFVIESGTAERHHLHALLAA